MTVYFCNIIILRILFFVQRTKHLPLMFRNTFSTVEQINFGTAMSGCHCALSNAASLDPCHHGFYPNTLQNQNVIPTDNQCGSVTGGQIDMHKDMCYVIKGHLNVL